MKQSTGYNFFVVFGEPELQLYRYEYRICCLVRQI